MTRSKVRLGIGAALVVATLALAFAAASLAGGRPSTAVEIVIRYSTFSPQAVLVPVGVPVTVTLRNDDPIDHEWIVGDEAEQALHRTGTELLHPDEPTEVFIPAMTTRTTTIMFERAETLQFICHLPAHENYGMVGTVTIR